MWDCYGLESIVDVSGKRQKSTMATLSGGNIKHPTCPEFFHMSMRARFNPQRNYEIYAVVCDPEITKDYIEMMFEENAQAAVDFIRDRGTKLLSYRDSAERVVV
jgi:hypothetical protein